MPDFKLEGVFESASRIVVPASPEDAVAASQVTGANTSPATTNANTPPRFGASFIKVEDDIAADDVGKGKPVVLKALQDDGSIEAYMDDFGGFDIGHIEPAFTDKEVVTIKKLEDHKYIFAFQDSEINQPPNFESVRLNANFLAFIDETPYAVHGSLRSWMVAMYMVYCVKTHHNSGNTK